jgi:serine/threonine protein phosphatase PrpC
LFRTEDHTIVELYKKRGFLTGHDFIPNKNIIWQALGTSREEIKPGVQQLANIQPGDRFLLASDGLAEACPDEELLQLFEQPSHNVAKALQDCCLKNSNDNFSFTLVDIN